VQRKVLVLVAASVVAAASTACSGGTASGSRPSLAATAAPGAAPVTADSTVPPVTASSARHLPPGVFYFLGGPSTFNMNLWEVTRTGAEKELTHNSRGGPIHQFAASSAGIVLADGLYDEGDLLARLTSKGVVWLRPWRHPREYIGGQAPGISATGQILYMLPPAQPGAKGSKYFTYWIKRSFTGRARLIYRVKLFSGGPIFGPRGQVAIIGPSGQPFPGQKPGAIIISADGHVAELETGFTRMGYPPLWGPHAEAIEIPPAVGTAELFFANGKREKLPAGWQPYSWNQDGNELLMLKGAAIGLWSMTRPGKVTTVGELTPGFVVEQINWLNRRAPL
jgi:hypothetical protein